MHTDSNGGIAQTVLATAQFLATVKGGKGGNESVFLLSQAVNRTYIDAAINYPKEVDIDEIIKSSTRKAGLQTSPSTSPVTQKHLCARMHAHAKQVYCSTVGPTLDAVKSRGSKRSASY